MLDGRLLADLGDYARWDQYSGIALALAGGLWLHGIVRAALRRDPRALAPVAASLPLLFVTTVVYWRLF